MNLIQRIPWLASAGIVLCGELPMNGGSSDELAYRSVEGRKLAKRFVQHSELELKASKFTVEGPDGPDENEGAGSYKIIDDETIEFEDVTIAAGEGKPKKAKRTFSTIDNAVNFESDEEDFEAKEIKNESGLLDKAVMFTWDAEEKSFAAAWFECEGNDKLLGPMVEDADFRGWLPGKKVGEDDTWTIDVAEFNNLQEPSGPMGYQREGAEEGEDDDTMSEGIRDNRKGEIKATYKGTREEDGVKVGVIAFEGKLSSSFARDVEQDEGPSAHQANEQSDEFEGELLWDLAAGHFRSLTCDSKITLSTSEQQSFEIEGHSFKLSQSQTFEGTKTYRFSCEEKKD